MAVHPFLFVLILLLILLMCPVQDNRTPLQPGLIVTAPLLSLQIWAGKHGACIYLLLVMKGIVHQEDNTGLGVTWP